MVDFTVVKNWLPAKISEGCRGIESPISEGLLYITQEGGETVRQQIYGVRQLNLRSCCESILAKT